MATLSPAWLLVFWLSALLVWQNEELDLTQFACGSNAVQQLYDTLALIMGHFDVQPVFFSSDERVSRSIMERCGVGYGDVVLELGFGSGRVARLLLEEARVRRYDGVELSEGMLNLTAQRIADGDLQRLHLHQSSDPVELLHNSDELSNGYSHALAFFVLDSLNSSDIERSLAGLRARLRPGGRLCIAALADVTERSLFLRLYKAAWRIVPILSGGRRPIPLQRFFTDRRQWPTVESWVELVDVWLPFHVLIASTGNDTAEHDRETMLERWAIYLVAAGVRDKTSESELRRAALASAEILPPGPMKDLANWWLPRLPNHTLRSFLEADLVSLSKSDMFEDYKRTLRAMPSAQLQQEMGSWIRSLETSELETWTVSDTQSMSFEELREHVLHTVDDAIADAVDDVDLTSELLRHKEVASTTTSRAHLQRLCDRIEQDLFVPPSEMSRSELERNALDHAKELSRIELEAVLLADYKNQTEEELRSTLIAELHDLTREEMEDRARDALEYAPVERLRSLTRVVAGELLSGEDLRMVASLAADDDGGADRAQGASGAAGLVSARDEPGRVRPQLGREENLGQTRGTKDPSLGLFWFGGPEL